MHRNEHIASLGYHLEATSDVTLVRPLLAACGLAPVEDGRELSEYVMATTAAGGLAACAGWTRLDDAVVLHSLAVAPPSRGSGVGASLLATAMAYIMDGAPVEAIHLMTQGARRFFALYGFVEVDDEEPVPSSVREHATFAQAAPGAVAMVRHYRITPRGLDQCALRVVENVARDAVLPVGSVLLIKQTGQLLEASYRGGVVARGHLLGRVDQDVVTYRWHAYSTGDELLHGAGELQIASREDGRRELRERSDEVTLLLREV